MLTPVQDDTSRPRRVLPQSNSRLGQLASLALFKRLERVRAVNFTVSFPPLRNANRRHAWGATPALAEGEGAAWPVRPRTGLPGVQPPLEISRGSRIAENRIKPSNFVLVPRVKNGRKKRLFLTLGSSSETRINTGFFPFLTLFLSQAIGQLPWGPGFRFSIKRGVSPPVRGRTGRVAGRAHWRAGNYQDAASLAREEPFAAGKKPERSQQSHWRGRALTS